MSPRAERWGAWALLAALGALAGCSVDNGECPPYTFTPLRGGVWRTATSAEGEILGDGGASFPHGRNVAEMVIDRDASVVTVTARVDGSVIVERWTLRPSR